jgi:hypothetical protein
MDKIVIEGGVPPKIVAPMRSDRVRVGGST